MIRRLSLIAILTAALAVPAGAAGRGGGHFGGFGGGHVGGFGGGHGAGVWHFHSGGPTGGGAWHWHGQGRRGYVGNRGYYLYGPGAGYDDSSCWAWDPFQSEWVWICD